ncbi:Vacuolar protein sorting-associated protein 29 [Echinococcus granulosus]|nr:Vacuolar protein sorting-associated protein 29 [Echinococcus granulosus]
MTVLIRMRSLFLTPFFYVSCDISKLTFGQHCFHFLVLVIGDFHIPDRSVCIHPAFKALLSPGKIHHVWCTGNLTSRTIYDQLKFICADVHVVKGDFDQLPFPETKVLTVGNLKIGLTHGHQSVPWGSRASLSMLRRQLNVDVLISGHTHVAEAYQYDGGIFLNPGSVTGAFTPLQRDPQPTFMLLDIQESTINLYTYRLVGNEHKVERTEFPRAA